MKFVFIVLLLSVCSLAQASTAERGATQTSTGNCSPNIVSNGNGPVIIHLPNSCNDIDPRVLAKLTKTLQEFLPQYPKTIRNLNELLDKKNVELADKAKEVEDWIKKYNELSLQLEQQPVGDELSKQAVEALLEGDFQRAEDILNKSLAKEEKQVDLIAQNQYNYARLLELRFKPLEALVHYQKAYDYRPDNPDYGHQYAMLLSQQNRFSEAEKIYENVLKIRRDLAKSNPQVFLPDVANTLNNLGALCTTARNGLQMPQKHI